MPKATRTYTYSVEGRGLFPFDMLRYDSAWPCHERDSSLIEATTRRERSGARRIQLVGLREPTTGRWESFGWRIVTG